MQSYLQGPGGQIWGDINGSRFKDMERGTHMTNSELLGARVALNSVFIAPPLQALLL